MVYYVKGIELAVLMGLSVFSDWKHCKIRNSMILTFLFLGVLTNLYYDRRNILIYLMGFSIPIIVLFPLFMLRMLGAGDIKLFAVIGFFTGMEGIIQVMTFSFLLGAAVAIAVMICRRNFLQRLRYMAAYLKSCILTLSLQEYFNDEESGQSAKFPFATGIALGTVTYFIRLNVSLS